ncbi:MAG: hypothetical protein MUF38_15060 [Anaerolineae bacterium]|jgi:hypothetical protein|nr:hypothetical protein [Anaerolineae bacterium]
MTDYRARLLTPPREEEEIRPYRSVWRSIIIENIGLTSVAAVSFVLFGILGVSIPDTIRPILNIAIALLPLVFWVLFSWLAERTVPQPRRQLLAVFLFSVLIARAVGQPLVEEFLRVQEWLPLGTAIGRIVGYTFTVGIVQVGLAYLVLYTLTWQENLRYRYDTLAYAAAAALGYGMLPSLEFAVTGQPNPYVVAAHTLSIFATLTVANCVVAYGLSAVRFDSAPALFMPFIIALGSLVTGLSIPLYSGFLNATFSIIGASVQRHVLGIGFTGAFLFGGLFLIYTLFTYAERRAADRELER